MVIGSYLTIKQGLAFEEFAPRAYGMVGKVSIITIKGQRLIVRFGPVQLGLSLSDTHLTFFVPYKGKTE